MLDLFKPKHRSILGIDVSSSSVKILEITYLGDKYRVEGYGCSSLPESSMIGNAIKDVDAVAGAIKNLVASSRVSARQAAIAVPDASAISKVIQVNDGMTENEIEELVIMEADKYIPYPIDEINMDFNVLGPSLKNAAMMDVLIVASRSEYINNRVDAIKKAGLEASIVDVESYAVERAAQFVASQLPAAGEKKVVAIIDIGAIYTHLFVLHGMKMIFTREEQFGGQQLIESIVEQYGLKAEEVPDALGQGKLPENYENEVILPFKELILLQVKRALQFFFSTSYHTFIDYLLLTGGVAKLPGLAELLQEHINIPTSVMNPFAQMELSDKVDREAFNNDISRLIVACGLALRRSS